MSKVLVTESKLVDVADAIREKLGENGLYTLDEMPDKIENIPTGGGGWTIPEDNMPELWLKDFEVDEDENIAYIVIDKSYNPSAVWWGLYEIFSETNSTADVTVGHIANNQFVADYETFQSRNNGEFSLNLNNYANNKLCIKIKPVDQTNGYISNILYGAYSNDYIVEEVIFNGRAKNFPYYWTANPTSYSKASRLRYIRYSKVEGCSFTNGYQKFFAQMKLEYADLSGVDTTGITSLLDCFQYCYNLKYLDITGWDTSTCTNFSSAFGYCYSLKEIKGIEDLDVSNATNLSYIFNNCYSLEHLDLSNWVLNSDGSINGSGMFVNNYNLKYLAIGDWDFDRFNDLYSFMTNANKVLYYFKLGQNCILNDTIVTNIVIGNWLGSWFNNDDIYRATFLDFARCMPTTETAKTVKIKRGLDMKLTDVDKAIMTDKGYTITVDEY